MDRLITYLLFIYISQYGGKIDRRYELLLHNSEAFTHKNLSIKKNSKLSCDDGRDKISKREIFYPHYGASGIRRRTNLYKNGKTRRKLKRETKLQRNTRLDIILSNHNKFNR